jgi:hypothetical protein
MRTCSRHKTGKSLGFISRKPTVNAALAYFAQFSLSANVLHSGDRGNGLRTWLTAILAYQNLGEHLVAKQGVI